MLGAAGALCDLEGDASLSVGRFMLQQRKRDMHMQVHVGWPTALRLLGLPKGQRAQQQILLGQALGPPVAVIAHVLWPS